MNETDSSESAWLTAKGQIRESVFCAQFLKQHPILSIGKFFIIRSVAGYAADSSALFDARSLWPGRDRRSAYGGGFRRDPDRFRSRPTRIQVKCGYRLFCKTRRSNVTVYDVNKSKTAEVKN